MICKKHRSSTLCFVLLFCLLSTKLGLGQDEDLRVLHRWINYTDAPNALYHHFYTQAEKYLDQRAAEVAGLQSQSDWQQRQRTVRQMLMEIVGPFPEKTPLNSRMVDVIHRKGYRVEKIIYESQPNFYVTACLFIPDGQVGKQPAIIYCSGHSAEAFRSLTYQKVCINLVKKGFIVLAFDPVGQGERLQYFDAATNESRVGGPTKEHSYPGAQCFISGSSQARYMIWDGIRTVDYLLTRQEVDPQRIGITGRSGGGTQSSYIAAFDERIYAAAPECYITSLKRLYQSIGPQDAEQNFYHGVARGFDHADLLEVRAPKPTMMITTTRDFFSIQGARETAAEVRRAYHAFGQAENFAMVEDDAPHASTKKNREAMYAFFQKHLNLPGNSQDQEVEYFSPEEMRITTSGQVLSSLGGETVFSLNRSETENLLAQLYKSRRNLSDHLQGVKKSAQELSGFIKPDANNEAMFTGRFQRHGYVVEKYFIPGEGDYVIPFLMMIPDDGDSHPAVIYLHPEGKSAQAGQGQEMEWFVKQGYAVVAPDLLGVGEMGPGVFIGDAYDFKLGRGAYNIWFAYIVLRRSIAGVQAGDLSRIVGFLQTRVDIDGEDISAVARSEMCPVLLHAAAFNDAIKKIALIEPLISYRSMVMNQYYQPRLIHTTVAGALTAYDLPDLAASLAPRKLLMANIKNHLNKSAGPELIDADLRIVRQAYSDLRASDQLIIRNWAGYQNQDDVFAAFVGQD